MKHTVTLEFNVEADTTVEALELVQPMFNIRIHGVTPKSKRVEKSGKTNYDWKEDHDAITAKARLVATQQIKVQRNKQVDVPTEAWQKSVERRLVEIDLFVERAMKQGWLNRD